MEAVRPAHGGHAHLFMGVAEPLMKPSLRYSFWALVPPLDFLYFNPILEPDHLAVIEKTSAAYQSSKDNNNKNYA